MANSTITPTQIVWRLAIRYGCLRTLFRKKIYMKNPDTKWEKEWRDDIFYGLADMQIAYIKKVIASERTRQREEIIIHIGEQKEYWKW